MQCAIIDLRNKNVFIFRRNIDLVKIKFLRFFKNNNKNVFIKRDNGYFWEEEKVKGRRTGYEQGKKNKEIGGGIPR